MFLHIMSTLFEGDILQVPNNYLYLYDQFDEGQQRIHKRSPKNGYSGMQNNADKKVQNKDMQTF